MCHPFLLLSVGPRKHVVFDLRGQKNDPGTYQQEVERLADALKQIQPASAGVPVSDISVDQLKFASDTKGTVEIVPSLFAAFGWASMLCSTCEGAIPVPTNKRWSGWQMR